MNSDVINRYFNGDCTSDEEKEVEVWLKNKENTLLAEQWLADEVNSREIINNVIASRNEAWKSIEDDYLTDRKHSGSSGSLFKNGYAVAAVMTVIVFSVLGGWLYQKQDKKVNISSGFGEVVKILLPDSSVVFLNGNSGLSYQSAWNDDVREVWLKGEAYFQVKHLKNFNRFLVHLNKEKTIEVLGTEFDVSHREGNSRLVLKSGKIKVSLPQKSILMRPGDLLEIDSSDNVASKVVDTELYSFWTTGRWKLEETSLAEILKSIEYNYGKKVGVYDAGILSSKASGTIPVPEKNDVGTLLSDVAVIFDFKVTIGKDSLYMISKR